MVKIKDGYRWPYFSTDRNHFRASTTRPQGQHLGQVLKQSDQWSRSRCGNKIVTVLSNGQLAILKMAAVRLYLSTDWNYFRACTTRPLGKRLGQVSKKSGHWSWRRCDNKILTVLRRSNSYFKDCCHLAIFVDGPESFLGGHI